MQDGNDASVKARRWTRTAVGQLPNQTGRKLTSAPNQLPGVATRKLSPQVLFHLITQPTPDNLQFPPIRIGVEQHLTNVLP